MFYHGLRLSSESTSLIIDSWGLSLTHRHSRIRAYTKSRDKNGEGRRGAACTHLTGLFVTGGLQLRLCDNPKADERQISLVDGHGGSQHADTTATMQPYRDSPCHVMSYYCDVSPFSRTLRCLSFRLMLEGYVSKNGFQMYAACC
jgi:hypothetical protein